MGVTEQQINDLISEASASIQKGTETSSTIGGQLKEDLLTSVGGLQDFLNSLLQKGGLVTEQQFNLLDEQTRLLKLKTLEAESQDSTNKFATFVGIGVAVIGIIWYLSRN